MITLKNVNKTYTSNKLHALKDISFEVKQGEIFGLIGMSGAGKSTILRTLSLLESYDTGSIVVNEVEINKMNQKQRKEYHKSLAVIFQGYNLLVQKTVFDNIALPLVLDHTPKAEIKDRVLKMIEIVGLQGKEQEYVSKISGGQKQRVAIARALVSNPKVLLCDEPTSALDSLTTAEVLKLIKRINEELNVTILIITHEMNVVRKVCHKVAVINNGEIVECEYASTLFKEPKHEITKLLLGVED